MLTTLIESEYTVTVNICNSYFLYKVNIIYL